MFRWVLTDWAKYGFENLALSAIPVATNFCCPVWRAVLQCCRDQAAQLLCIELFLTHKTKGRSKLRQKQGYSFAMLKTTMVPFEMQGVPKRCIHIKNNCKRSVLLEFYYFKCVQIFTNNSLLFFSQHFDYILNNCK